MSPLLERAVEAHGGLDRWEKIRSIDAAVSITGAIGHLEGRPDVLADLTVALRTDVERVTTDFVGQDRRTVSTPDRVVVETRDGTPVQVRVDPESSFAGQQADTPRDGVHGQLVPEPLLVAIDIGDVTFRTDDDSTA